MNKGKKYFCILTARLYYLVCWGVLSPRCQQTNSVWYGLLAAHVETQHAACLCVKYRGHDRPFSTNVGSQNISWLRSSRQSSTRTPNPISWAGSISHGWKKSANATICPELPLAEQSRHNPTFITTELLFGRWTGIWYRVPRHPWKWLWSLVSSG